MRVFDERLDIEGFDMVFRSPKDETALTIAPMKVVWPKLGDDPTNIVQFYASAQLPSYHRGISPPLFSGSGNDSFSVSGLTTFVRELSALRASLEGTVKLATHEGQLDLRLTAVGRSRGIILVEACLGRPFLHWERSKKVNKVCEDHGNPASLRLAFLTEQSYLLDVTRSINALLVYVSKLRGNDSDSDAI